MGIGSRREMASAAMGLIYGVVLTFYAVMFSVDGPTLPMPLAASPLIVPAILLDAMPITSFSPAIVEAVTIVSILAAPFCWAAMAFLAADVQHPRYRRFLVATLWAHYAGIAACFLLLGPHLLLKPFVAYYHDTGLPLNSKGLKLVHIEPILIYATGQILLWWELLHSGKSRITA